MLTFRLNALVVIRVKVKEVRTNVAIYSHALLRIHGCWIAVMRRQGGRSNPHRPLTSNDMYPQ